MKRIAIWLLLGPIYTWRFIIHALVPGGPATCRFECLGRPPNGNIVAFGAAAREEHLGRIRSKQGRHLCPGLVDRRFGLLPEMVDARGITEFLPQGPCHSVDNLGKQGGSCVMVEIDSLHGCFQILAFHRNSQLFKA